MEELKITTETALLLNERVLIDDNVDLKIFKEQIRDVYSSSLVESKVDEAPDSYKLAKLIIGNIDPTAEILHLVKPVYNFKSHELRPYWVFCWERGI